MRQHSLKQRLQSGQPAIGSWLSLGSPLGAEWMAHQGFDWLAVEHERGPIDLTLTAQLLRAMSMTDVTPLVRLSWTEPQTIAQALATGARGLLFHNIETREQALSCARARLVAPSAQHEASAAAGLEADFGADASASAHFSAGAPFSAGAHFGARTGRDALKSPDPGHGSRDILVVVMIETALGLRNIDQILSVPGIDACMVGPSELSAALGLEPDMEPTGRRYFEAIKQVYAACRRYGVAPGLHVRTTQRAIQHLEEGWQLIAVASDGELMARAAADVSSAIRTHMYARTRARFLAREPRDPELPLAASG